MATTFADMQTAVDELTKRPELAVVRNSAIRMATVRAHHTEMFHRDQESTLLTYTVNTATLFQDITGLYDQAPLLRIPNFLQMEDVVTLQPAENLEFVPDFEKMWDENNETRLSVFTLYGSLVKLRAISNTGRARLHYYKNPNVTSDGYSSWIADLYKEELAMWAAGIVWARSGDTEKAKMVQDMHITPFKEMLVESHLMQKI